MLAEEAAEVHQSISGRAAEEQLQRVKRVSTDDDDVQFDSESNPRPKQKSKSFVSRANDNNLNFPVVLPPYGFDVTLNGDEQKDCMLYLEGITIVVLDIASIESKHIAYLAYINGSSPDTFGYQESYISCPILNNSTKNNTAFKFTIDLDLKNTYSAEVNKNTVFTVTGNVNFVLHFNESFGLNFLYAELNSLTINVVDHSLITADLNPKGLSRNDSITNIRSYSQYNYACSSTQAIWFDGSDNYLVGIVLNNVQIQSSHLQNTTIDNKLIKYFSTLTADCQPTFSPGSWMGIIVTLILVSVLMFGFLMLNSVQTMDRFDDPKQKQIVINFKE